MRYLPAGELLTSKGSDVKKNSGWITTFSVLSSELHSAWAMFGIGGVILIVSLSFVVVGKIESESALWSSVSGGILIVLGVRKLIMQKKKMQKALSLYPYWEK
ncbi:MAG: hypothetical protein KKD01_18295 [Proteobacteria bacterium]|nr:hypothetical protein [Pseudomonadota bacterium]MBU1420760.1 hypothetical protein [Pseudomonadota bacterium]MBU1456670.1 hypothetical protein [Pseudomonadota bacterium]